MNIKRYTVLFLLVSSVFAHAQNIQLRHFPVPETVSTQIQPLVSGEPAPMWNDHPQTNQEWKIWVNQLAQHSIQQLPALREQMQVTVEPMQFAGVSGFIITSKQISFENKNRVLLHFHGGGYVLNPGEAGTDEAILMAGFGRIKEVSIDYRMAPDFPFPAAIDDAVSAYRAILKQYPADRIGVFGISTDGGITLALMLKAKAEDFRSR